MSTLQRVTRPVFRSGIAVPNKVIGAEQSQICSRQHLLSKLAFVALADSVSSATTIDLNPHEVPRTPSAARPRAMAACPHHACLHDASRLRDTCQPCSPHRLIACRRKRASSAPPLLKAPHRSHDLSAFPGMRRLTQRVPVGARRARACTCHSRPHLAVHAPANLWDALLPGLR